MSGVNGILALMFLFRHGREVVSSTPVNSDRSTPVNRVDVEQLDQPEQSVFHTNVLTRAAMED